DDPGKSLPDPTERAGARRCGGVRPHPRDLPRAMVGAAQLSSDHGTTGEASVWTSAMPTLECVTDLVCEPLSSDEPKGTSMRISAETSLPICAAVIGVAVVIVVVSSLKVDGIVEPVHGVPVPPVTVRLPRMLLPVAPIVYEPV